MAKIYKFEGYILDPNGDDIDVEEILKGYGHTFMLKTHCGCEEFEWDDDLEVNNMDADYWVADKLYCQLGYDRAARELRESKSQLNQYGFKCKDCSHLTESGYCMINQDYKNDNDLCPAITINIGEI